MNHLLADYVNRTTHSDYDWLKVRRRVIFLFWWILWIEPNYHIGPNFSTRDKCEAFRVSVPMSSFGCYDDGKDHSLCEKAYVDYLKRPPATVCVSSARVRTDRMTKQLNMMRELQNAKR